MVGRYPLGPLFHVRGSAHARRVGRALESLLLLLLMGCRVAGGPTLSAGSVGVPGTATGLGGGLELELHHPSGFAAAVTADLGGYSTAADADPILWSEIQGRYRIPLYDDGLDRYRVFVTPGVGIGYAWCCYVDAPVLAGFFEIAAERSLGGFRVGLSARVRPALFVNGGTPYAEPHGTFSLAFTFGVGR